MGKPISLLQEELAFPFEKQGVSHKNLNPSLFLSKERNISIYLKRNTPTPARVHSRGCGLGTRFAARQI